MSLPSALPRPRAGAALRLPRPRPRAAVAAVLTLLVAAGAWLWLRDSSLVRVREVSVTGVTASDGDRVRAALERAATGMTTLHVREDVLRDAVRPFASVADVRASAHVPHRLTIEVVERRTVAAIATGARRIPVTAAGLVLAGLQADRDVPDLQVALPGGTRLAGGRARQALAVAGAAPDHLLHRAARFLWGPRGLILAMRAGPDLIFGDATRARVKWMAAARVLAEPSAAGATYLDLRLPGRVAAGGLGPLPVKDTANPLLDSAATGVPTPAPATAATPAPGAVATATPAASAAPATTPSAAPTAVPQP